MTYTKIPYDSTLDMAPWVGQRSATFTFTLYDGATGIEKGTITPLRGATLSHDTTRTIKRQLQLNLGVADTAAIDTISDRIRLSMEVGGKSWPLGSYVFTADTQQNYTSGNLSSVALNDFMFIVDQPIQFGIDGNSHYSGGAFVNPTSCETIIRRAITDANLGIEFDIEATSYLTNQAWSIGTQRGQLLDSVALAGNYFSPWFGNDSKLHFIQAFEPAEQIPDFDFDSSNNILRSSPPTRTSDLLTAPNRFIVVLNITSVPTQSAVGIYDIPDTAPHSIANRGFVISKTFDLQAPGRASAQAMARNLGIRNTVFETVQIQTAPDPRHDSYNVIKWQDSLWLELAWSMALTEGGAMTHTLRKAYGQ